MGGKAVRGGGRQIQGPPSRADGCRPAHTRYANFMAAAPREERVAPLPARAATALRWRGSGRTAMPCMRTETRGWWLPAGGG